MSDATIARPWSDRALKVCLVCDMLWSGAILAACTYIVFWMNHSGWWYVLAILLAGMWNCKPYRSPAQIEADRDDCECKQ